MNMRQWFSGQLDGQYVGRPKGRNASATHQAGEVFEIEITRAVVAQIQLGLLESERDENDSKRINEPTLESETEASHHHKVSQGSFYQVNVAQVFFLEAMGPGKTVRSGAHDVLVSEVLLSDPARKDGKTYGRIRGTVSGWFRPLPAPLPAVEVIAPARPGEVWQSEVLTSAPSVNEEFTPDSTTSTLKPNISEGASVESSKSLLIEDDAAKVPPSDTAYAESDLPFFTIGSVLALGMFVVAGWFAALTWYAGFLPAVGLRRWLYGIIPEGWFTRGFAIFAVALQLVVATVLIASWQETGCKNLHPFVLAFLLCGQYLCCLLPRAAGFAITAGVLAAVIAQFYGPLGSICP